MALIRETPSVHTTTTEPSTLAAVMQREGARTIVVLRDEADLTTRATRADVLFQVRRAVDTDAHSAVIARNAPNETPDRAGRSHLPREASRVVRLDLELDHRERCCCPCWQCRPRTDHGRRRRPWPILRHHSVAPG
jgi:hypothetical protein